jgi:mono/diheme cytochrome c family protein
MKMKSHSLRPKEKGTNFVVALTLVGTCSIAPNVGLAQEDEIAGAGRFQYQTHCANCHGVSGKGNGPMANELMSKPADLTQLSRKNEGKFPLWRVYQVIDGREAITAHGERSMPIWGSWFLKTEGNELLAIGRVLELGYYLKSIQEQ